MMAGLLDDVVAGARAVEVPENLVGKVASVTIGLQEQHLANAALMDDFHGGSAIRIVAQLEAGLENSLGAFGGVGHHAALLGGQRHGLFTDTCHLAGDGHLFVESTGVAMTTASISLRSKFCGTRRRLGVLPASVAAWTAFFRASGSISQMATTPRRHFEHVCFSVGPRLRRADEGDADGVIG